MKQAMTIFNMLIYTAYSNDSGYNSSYVFVTLLIRMCPSPSCAASVMLCSSGVYCVISHTGAKTSEYALVSTGMYVCMRTSTSCTDQCLSTKNVQVTVQTVAMVTLYCRCRHH